MDLSTFADIKSIGMSELAKVVLSFVQSGVFTS